MGYWVRYLSLVLICIVAPLGYAFYEDTQLALTRAESSGNAAADVAPSALSSQLKLKAHQAVGRSLLVAQELGNLRLVPPKPRMLEKIVSAIDAKREGPDAAFIWVLDDNGGIIARKGQTELDESPEHITGHPLFRETQRGYALDGYWVEGDKMFFVGAVPLVEDGVAKGAVFAGYSVDAEFVGTIAKSIETELTILLDGRTVVSTLPESTVEPIIAATQDATAPVLGGRLARPLEGTDLFGFLPLFVPKDGEGLAYASVAQRAPTRQDIRWLISVPAAEGLRDLALRQQTVLGMLVISVLIAMGIGYRMSRNYVRPIGLLVEHLSQLNMGSGAERELAEHRVARPFRRLVKLINMTVQKVPTSARAEMSLGRTLSMTGAPADELDLPASAAEPEPASLVDALDGELAASQVTEQISTSAPQSLGDILSAESVPAPPMPDANLSFQDVSSELGQALAAPVDATLPPQPMPAMTAPPPAPPTAMAAPPAPPPAAPAPIRSASEIRGAPASQLGMDGGPPPPPPATNVGPPAAPVTDPFQQMVDPDPAAALSPGEQDDVMAYIEGLQGAGGASPPPPGAAPQMGGSAQVGGSAAQDMPPPSSSGFGTAGIPAENPGADGGFRSEATVVHAPDDDLLARAAAGGLTQQFELPDGGNVGGPDRTVVADVPADLLEKATGSGIHELGDERDSDTAHFQETYERFIDMRRACGEPTADLAFDKFVAKLRKNREGLVKKYNCRTVRFQVYKKEGRAALKATPIRN